MSVWTATLCLDGTEQRLVSVSHRERASEVAHTECTVVLEGDPPKLGDLIGKAASILVEDRELATSRAIAGIVLEAEIVEIGDAHGVVKHRLELLIAPRLARLALRADCRTFQKMTPDAVARKVLEGAGYAAGEIDVNLGTPPTQRDWTVQYDETDLQFLERLLAEEGVLYVAYAKDDVDHIALFDGDRGDCTPASLRAELRGGLDASADAITDLAIESEPRPGKVTMREYDFESPRLGLEVSQSASKDGDFEVFEMPGRYPDEAEGKKKAGLLLEALRTGRNRVTGVASALGLELGKKVTVEGHPYEPLDGAMWISALRLEYGEAQGRSRIELEAVPVKDGPVRPPPRPYAARVAGLQSAFISGASGKEISADHHGRVTVWLPWDPIEPKDDKSSLPLRALQLPLGGSQLTPRVGWEVTIGAFEGDLDAPLVLGRMMNAAAPPPYPLPAGKTKFAIQTATTPGGGSVNEIRFDDAKGSEELFINASKDASVGVGNNATDKVTVDEVRTIGGDQSTEIGGGWTGVFKASQMITIGGSQTAKAATKGVDESGSHTLMMGGSRSLTVGGDYKKTASGGSTLSVGGSAIDLVIGSFDTKAKATFTETIGAADVILALTKNLHVVGARSEQAGAAKVILVKGDRTAVAASLDQTVYSAVGNVIKGDRSEAASGDFTEVAGGAHVIQATNITIEATDVLSIIMGASTLTLTPPAIAIAGASVTLDGTVKEGIAVLDL